MLHSADPSGRGFPDLCGELVVAETRRAWIALAAFNAEVSYVRDLSAAPLPAKSGCSGGAMF
jgi:hypothetical protein